MYAPLLIAGLAASLAGTGMGIAGNIQSQNALKAERAREAGQQGQFAQRGAAIVNQSLPQSSEPVAQKQIAEGAANRMGAFQALRSAAMPATAANAPQTGYTITGDNSPTANAAKVAQGGSNAWGNLMSTAQANEGGISDWENQQNIKNSIAMSNLGEVGVGAQSAASIYPAEQQIALQAGGPMSGWGQLLQSLGGLAMMGGAVGLGAPAAAAPAGAASGATQPLSVVNQPSLWSTLAGGGAPAGVPTAQMSPAAWARLMSGYSPTTF